MYLSDGKIGEKYRIKNLSELGRNIRNRLIDLGLIDCDFLVVINSGGPVLIEVRNTRLAIGRGMARKIEIMLLE